LKLATGIKITLAVNCLLLGFFFGKAYWLGTQINEINAQARTFAQKHDLHSKEKFELKLDDPSSFDRVQRHGELFLEYMDLLAPARALNSKRIDYLFFGKMCFLGFPILGAIAFTLRQRESDNLKLPEASFDQLRDSVFESSPRKRNEKERIAISTSEESIYFDGFALLKGLSLIPRKKAFQIPFSSVVDCFHQPLKDQKARLILVTTDGKIIIENTISDYEKLFDSFKAMAARTPEAGLIHKLWFQGLLVVPVIVAGVALIFGVFLYFFD